MSSNDLNFASIRQLAKILRRREISSIELTRLFLDRLETFGARYNALAELTRELALRQARRADKMLANGKDHSVLLGIPYGAKDLLSTNGIPTRWGAPPFKNQIPKQDATVIRRLADAGAVLIGKLAMVELAGGGGYSSPAASLHGPGLNPWNPDHWSGGSSSGSGSAVAAGLVPFALGSETWGSIINPSASCGITGLRPTWGLVSRHGAMELAWSMDKIGPMARTAADCGIILEAISGPDPLDWTTMPTGFRFTQGRRVKQIRAGVLPADLSADIGETYDRALRVLRRIGIQLENVKLDTKGYADIANTLLMGECAAVFEKFIKSRKVDELVDGVQKKGLKKYLTLRAGDYVKAEKRLGEINRGLRAIFEEFDLLVSPSLVSEAVPITANLGKLRRRRGNYSVLGALCGVPQLTMPMGFGKRGLPLGISLTGDLFSENLLLQVGSAYQRETDWHLQRPPVFDLLPHTVS